MIISASRRTDIPALYGTWFMNRIREGFCEVPNPFNPGIVSHVPLDPTETEAIVFWTRYADRFLPHLEELESRGYRYYFQFTLTAYPRCFEPGLPPLERRIESFLSLSLRLGPERVLWRYDPIVLSDRTGYRFHLETFSNLVRRLSGATRRCAVSFPDPYPSVNRRMAALSAAEGYRFFDPDPDDHETMEFLTALRGTADEHGITVVSCAERFPLERAGIMPGACVDGELINRLFGVAAAFRKDPGQRKLCRCTVSRDIGMYDTCTFRCVYCYATKSFRTSHGRLYAHDASSPSLFRFGPAADSRHGT
jgi:hypothetical protein